MRAGCVLSAVGSLRHVRVRFADRPEPTDLEGPFKIVLGELPGVVFTRESDVITGYRELVVSPRSPSGASASLPPRGTVP